MEYHVALSKIIQEFSLETVTQEGDPEEIMVSSADVIRPGLQLGGFFDFYDNKRLQLLGRMETAFMERFVPEKRQKSFTRLLETRPPAVIVTRGLPIGEELIAASKETHVPVLRTQEATSAFMSGLISFLNVELAPRLTQHGVLVEVYGEGVLLLGESGVGKSETAIELVKRGHRLIADDAVEIRRVSGRTLVGQSPENIRHFIELRGIGIVNARRIFGVGAVKLSEIDLVVKLEPWDSEKVYDRMGMENQYTEILGIRAPYLCIPVQPGRNLAVIIEVAAMNNRQKKMGYNAARELLTQLGMDAANSDID